MTDVVYTSSDSNVLIESADGSIDVLITESESSVIVSEGESSTQINTTTDSVTIIESISIGPQGPPGDALAANPGTTEGDILRWNATTEAWEVKSEPFEFGQIVLTPALAALADIEGGLWYDSATKSVMVCTSNI